MNTRIVRIGNSQGIRIPKPLLDESGLRPDEDLELAVEPNQITIRRANRARKDWAESFLEMAKRGDDTLLDPDALANSPWDENEWHW